HTLCVGTATTRDPLRRIRSIRVRKPIPRPGCAGALARRVLDREPILRALPVDAGGIGEAWRRESFLRACDQGARWRCHRCALRRRAARRAEGVWRRLLECAWGGPPAKQ